MLGIPALLAGCKEIICTPPDKNGKYSAIYFLRFTALQEYSKPAAQLIAAMAYGTKSIPSVFKIFGPGNQYVTSAKQILQSKVAIDMPAGPSEVLVIADETAVPAFVAADLLAQAEHGPDSQVILVSTNDAIARHTQAEIKRQLETLPRKDIAAKALQHARIVLLKETLLSQQVCRNI